MIIGRIFGWLFLGGALLAASAEIATALHGRGWQSLALDEFWSSVSPASLNGFHRIVTAGPAPWIWDSGIGQVLMLPAWPVLLVLGALLLYSFRSRGAVAVARPGASR